MARRGATTQGLSLAVGGHLPSSRPTGKGPPWERPLRPGPVGWAAGLPGAGGGPAVRALGAGGAKVKGSRHRVPPYGLERRDVLGPGRRSERSCCAGLARPAGREGTLCPWGILSAAPVASVGCALGPATRQDGSAAPLGCGEVVIKVLNLWCVVSVCLWPRWWSLGCPGPLPSYGLSPQVPKSLRSYVASGTTARSRTPC